MEKQREHIILEEIGYYTEEFAGLVVRILQRMSIEELVQITEWAGEIAEKGDDPVKLLEDVLTA